MQHASAMRAAQLQDGRGNHLHAAGVAHARQPRLGRLNSMARRGRCVSMRAQAEELKADVVVVGSGATQLLA